MRAVDLFHPFVLPFAEGCSSPMASQAILSACIEFSSTTQLVQRTFADDVVAGWQDYDVETPSQMTLVRVLRVFYKDSLLTAAPLHAVSPGTAVQGAAIGDVDMHRAAAPAAYFMRDPAASEYSLYPVPTVSVTNGLTVRAAFAPTRTASQVDDVLFEDYAEQIAHGALGRLLAMPAQPFTDAKTAVRHLAAFRSAMASAMTLARTGQLVASSRVAPVRFN